MKAPLHLPSVVVAVAVCALGCESKDKKPEAAPAPSASAAVVEAPAPDAAPQAPPPAAPGLITSWRKDMGMKAPAAVLHDEAADMYLVSCIDGQALDADGNGFISRWDPGAIGGDTKWIASGKNGVTLNAPKGMAITGEVLWVADINTVRTFDRKSGRPTGEVKIAGATSLQGMAVLDDGRVVVADSGGDSEENGAIHAISRDKKAVVLSKGKELGGPSGLATVKGKLWVASSSGQLYSLGASGLKNEVTRMPKGKLAGLGTIGDDFLVASLDARGIYRGKADGQSWDQILEGAKGAADFAYDTKRKRLIVPVMEEDEVRAYGLE